MHSGRPDSAKSTRTRITVDSQINSKDLNMSKFSQTYSNGVKNNNQKKIQFDQYVSQKNKDPKFKKYLNTNMPQIPEKSKPSQQSSKIASKPFERRGQSKIRQQKIEKKLEEQILTKKQIQAITIKKQNMKNGKSFVERNKQKLNSLKITSTIKLKQKQQAQESTQQQQKNTGKPQISFTGFTYKQPGKQIKKVQQLQVKVREKLRQKSQKTNKQEQQANQRRQQLNQLSRFIEEVENRNQEYYPSQYNQFVRKNQEQQSDINKININDFMGQPNEKDYDHLIRTINENQKKLEGSDNKSQTYNKSMTSSSFSAKSSSINLDQMIDERQNSHQYDQDEQRSLDNASVAMSSMTAAELRDRNMFLTQILKGRITEDKLMQLKQSDDTHMKLIKIQHEDHKKEDYASDEEVQMVKINMSKKKTTRIIERNKIEAAGQLYYQCDYLSPQQQQRIEDLVNGIEIQSPFVPTQFENFQSRRINQGIRIHRQLAQCEETQLDDSKDIITDMALPKDPILRREAEMKILKDKISTVNKNLRLIDEVVVNKSKIEGMVKKYRDCTKVSELSQSMMIQKNMEHEEQGKKLKQARQIIERVCGQKEQIDGVLDELYRELEREQEQVDRLGKMDVEQMRQMQLKQLEKKKEEVKVIEQEVRVFGEQIVEFERVGEQIRRNLRQLDQIVNLSAPNLRCDNYQEGETIEDLDRIICIRWHHVEDTVRQSQHQ